MKAISPNYGLISKQGHAAARPCNPKPVTQNGCYFFFRSAQVGSGNCILAMAAFSGHTVTICWFCH